MRLELGIGDRTQALELDDNALLATLEMRELARADAVPAAASGGVEESLEALAIRAALQNPIGTPRLRDIVHPDERICIVSSDITRPMPTGVVLPFVLEELDAAGVPRENVELVLALGSHRPHTPQEREALVGKWQSTQLAVRDSSTEDVVDVGTTTAGTPVHIDRGVATADRRICLGNIEYHYFAGYSGGAKAVMPGCATPATIQANHRMMLEDAASTGVLEGNPVRADLEEALDLLGAYAGRERGIDFILNVILDEDKRVVRAVAGDVIEAHRAGCKLLDQAYRIPIPGLADIVVASQGGSPKDINLYQTQKALDNAIRAVKPGGFVVLVGACTEGYGNAIFTRWLDEAQSPADLIERVNRKFELGGHKAAAIALALQRARVLLVSDMDEALVRNAFMEPFASVQEAFDFARTQLAQAGVDTPSVIAMPHAGSTLPELQ